MELIKSKENEMNDELVSKYFLVQNLGTLLKQTKDLKNKQLVTVIKIGLSDFKNEIKNMSEKDKETEKPNEMRDIVEKILEFNKQNQERKRL